MKHSCYFAKVIDEVLNKKHRGVNIFSLQLCVHEQILNVLCENGTNCFQDVLDYFFNCLGR